MSAAADALFYSVRPRVLFKYFGQLCFVIAALILLLYSAVNWSYPSATPRFQVFCSPRAFSSPASALPHQSSPTKPWS